LLPIKSSSKLKNPIEKYLLGYLRATAGVICIGESAKTVSNKYRAVADRGGTISAISTSFDVDEKIYGENVGPSRYRHL
jgi:hypothetical protein